MAAMITGDDAVSDRALYRLLSWVSPAFPVGAFSYSHGLEAMVESRVVVDGASLAAWVAAVVAHGGGRVDADIMRDAYRATEAGDVTALIAANRRGLAFRTTAELARESSAQGAAFLATCSTAWPDEFLDRWAMAGDGPRPAASMDQVGEPTAENAPDLALAHTTREGATPPTTVQRQAGEGVCYAAALGAAMARAAVPLQPALVACLQAMAANLVSAGLRLGIIGQTDGQRILAALEPVTIRAAQDAITRGPADFGGATFAVDLASMAHETQYTRLFRS